MKRRECEQMADDVVEAMKRAIKAALTPSRERIATLEKRLTALEERGPAIEYAGVFDVAKTYHAGQLATRSGGLWLCLGTTVAGITPGTDNKSWRLIVKKGEA